MNVGDFIQLAGQLAELKGSQFTQNGLDTLIHVLNIQAIKTVR
jgi:hypothetical protein